MVKLTVKWGATSYEVEADLSLPAVVFKSQLFSLTGVPVERQKIMGVKNPPLKARSHASVAAMEALAERAARLPPRSTSHPSLSRHRMRRTWRPRG